MLAAVTGLVDVKALRDIWRFDRTEFAATAAAVIGVLGSGLLNGVLVGVGVLDRCCCPPRLAAAGQRSRTRAGHVVLRRHRPPPENERIPGVLVVRPEASLVFFNVDHVHDRIEALLAASAPPPRLVILLMAAVPFVDLAGSRLVLDLRLRLDRQGIALRLAEARDAVCDALRRVGGDDAIDATSARVTVADAVRDHAHDASVGGSTRTLRPTSDRS